MIELGLQRISRLLARTPLPWRAIHVAGTNGKGSICAYISGMLDAYNASTWRADSGKRPLVHGRYTSPHLVDRWDCISINQTTVPFAVFDNVEQMVLERNEREGIGATEFELLTATAFEIFTREKVDLAVVEVGMGGRQDATNVLGQTEGLSIPKDSTVEDFRPAPLVTVISSIGLDHQAFLGNTLADIAREKAGIIKPGVPVVYDKTNPVEVHNVIRAAASDNLFIYNQKQCWPVSVRRSEVWEEALSETKKALKDDPNSRLKHVHTNRLSHHNANLAFMATWLAVQRVQSRLVNYHRTSGLSVASKTRDDIIRLIVEMQNVVYTTQFPGRQQRISIEALTGRRQDILLDGAHNNDSAVALDHTVRSRLRQIHPDRTQQNQKPSDPIHRPVTWVLAASDSKDIKEILRPLIRDNDSVFAVEFGPVDGMPWVKPVRSSVLLEEVKAVVSNHPSLSLHDCGKDVLAALKGASEKADGGPLVVAGSLYLVGDVLRLLRNETHGSTEELEERVLGG